jgi:transcriptional regulator with XRE-family HTH domain
MSVFSDRLKELRLKAKVPQSLIAKEIGVSEIQYQNYEYAKHEPKLKYVIALADYFNVSVDYIAGFSDDPIAITLRDLQLALYNGGDEKTNAEKDRLIERVQAWYDVDLFIDP